MKRRNFLGATIVSGLGLPFYSFAGKNQTQSYPEVRDVFSMDKNQVQIYTKAEIKPTRIFHITDTHLALD
jgi:hypothetical protein